MARQTIASRKSEALAVLNGFWQQETETEGYLNRLVKACQGITAKEAKEKVFQPAEKAFKAEHKDVKRMPQSWRTAKTTILTALAADGDSFNKAQGYNAVRKLYNAATAKKKAETQKQQLKQAEKFAQASDSEISEMSQGELQKAVHGSRRDIIERVSKLPMALQVRFWQNEELESLVTKLEKDYEDIRIKAEANSEKEKAEEAESQTGEAAQAQQA